MVDKTSAQQSYCRFEIVCTGLVEGEKNAADGVSTAFLNLVPSAVIISGEDITRVVQFIPR